MSKPFLKVRRGGLCVAVWCNENERGVSHSFKLEKRYKAKNGQWENSEYLFENDVLVAAELLREAWRLVLPTEGTEKAPTETQKADETPW